MGCSGVFLLVVSQLLLTVAAQNQCTRGDICLAGGTGRHEGRVQVCGSDGRWGTVCDDSWDNTDATVVCRQLGYTTTGARAFSNAFFGSGTGTILMDDVACTGSELQLTACSHISFHNCGHHEDASARCSQTRQSQQSGVCYSQTTAGTAYRSVARTTSYLTYTSCGFLWLSRCSRRTYRTEYVSQAYTLYISSRVCCSGYSGTSCTPACSGGCGNGRCTSPGVCTCNVGWSGTGCTRAICCNGCVNGRCTGPDVCTCNSGWTGSSCTTPVCSGGCANGICTGPGECNCNSGWTGSRCSIAICPGGCVNGRCTSPGVCTCYSGWAGPRCTLELCTGREGAVRLAGGTSLSGRVEVCKSGTWGTVCDDLWDNVDASVVCYQLGFSRNNAVGTTFRTQGTGSIHMDNVRCTGTESTLLQCPHISQHNCHHSEDAGVTCQRRLCNDGAIRLVSREGVIGGGVTRGRVEVCVNETWGTVCDQRWSSEDASVVCGQLGYLRSGASAYSDALFGQGTGPILFSNVVCTGAETSLLNCTSNSIGVTGSCTHADDAGVRCRRMSCNNGDLYLVDGLSEKEGRLEVCYNNQWGTVCDDLWTVGSTQVACRQLEVRDTTHVDRLQNNIFSTALYSVPILLDNVACTGSETRLFSCPRNPVGQENCGHGEDISVRCGVCREGDVRLADGGSENEGRVEVCLSGRWGTICDDGWSPFDARVVCRQLGYPTTGARALSGTSFTPNFSLPIVMDDVACGSSEATLSACRYLDSQNLRFCTHSEDARLHCPLAAPGAPQNIRLLSITSYSIRLSWTPPAPTVPARAPITRYFVTCTAPGQPSHSSQTSSSTRTYITLTGLRPYILYSCCVKADSSVGVGASICRSYRTSEAAPSGPPLNVVGVPTSSRSISLSWQPPLSANGQIRSYHINITEQNTSRTWTTTTTSRVYQRTGLHPHYIYSVKVAAVTVATGPDSMIIFIHTYPDIPSGAPSTPVSSIVTSTSFRLMWQPPALQYQNGILTYYRLRLENRRTGSVSTRSIHASSVSYSAGGLSPYTLYECSVAAQTVNGTGPYSPEHSVRTSEDVPSTAPRYTRHTVLSPTSLVIRWSSPSSQYTNGVIRHYSLRLNNTLTTATGTSYTVQNLHPYYIYAYSVAAFTVGLGPYSQQRIVRMPPARPSGPPLNLRATSRRLTSITIAWQPPHLSQQNGVISNYTVQITPPGGSSYTVVTTGLSWTASSLLGNSRYSFSVAASTVVGRGPFSNPLLSVQTLRPAQTSPPQDVTIFVLDHERVHVTWTPPPISEQSGDITGYTIRVTEQETGRTWEERSNLPQWTLNNLHPYYTYEVQVKVIPSSGSGLYSAIVRARTLPSVPSGAPNIIYNETTQRSVFLRWTHLPPSQRNGNITGYIINFLEDGQEHTVSVASSTLEYTIEASPYTEYVLRVAAVNTVGQGPLSVDVVVRTKEDVPSHHPMNLMGVALTSKSISLTWDPPPEDNHNGEIDSYTVLCTEVKGGRSQSQYTTSTTNLTIVELHPYYTYNCTVSAVTVGHGPFSDISITTLEDVPSGSPMNLNVTDKGPDLVSLSWTEPELTQQNGIIRHYIINVYPTSSPSYIRTARTSSNSTFYTLIGLHPFTLYRISVAAVTIAAGPSSEFVEVQTTEDAPSDSPHSIMLSPLSPYSLSITWQPPPVGSQNGEIQYYVIRVLEDETMLKEDVNTSDHETHFTLNDLHPYYHYNVSIAAVSVGIGPFSSSRTVHMPATAPSSHPCEFSGRALSSTSIYIQWDPPLPEHHNGHIEAYILLCIDSNGGGTLSRHTTTTTDITISGLHPFYTYMCNVSAVTVDEGPFSDIISITTLEDVPSAPPYNLMVKGIGSSNVSLSWSEPDIDQRNGIIRNYRIHVIPRESWLQASRHVTPSAQAFYTVEELHPYSTYDITMAAITIGPGPNSTNVLIQTKEDAPSAAPMEVTTTPLTAQSLVVSWEPPPEEFHNGVIRSYAIQVLTIITGQITVVNSSLWNITIDSLHPFYEYQVSVAAITVKIGPYSSEVIVRMPESAPTGSPTVTRTDASSSSIHLRWNPPDEMDQNGIIIAYIVDYFVSNPNSSIAEETNSTEILLDAQPYTNYQLRVAALNAAGQGPFSEFVSVDTLQDAPSHEPTSLRAVALSSSSIHLEWEPPPTEHHNGVIVSYTVMCSEVESNGAVTEHISTTTNITISGLHPFYIYSCTVSAVTVSQGPFSDSVHITTLEDVPSGRPYNLTVVDKTPHSISISWTQPDPSQWNGVLRHYLLYVTPVIDSSSTTTHSTVSPLTYFNITGLRPYTFHQIKVAAVTIAPGSNSSAELIRTAEDVPSAPPQDVYAILISSTNLSVTWRAPPHDSVYGEVRHYNITVREVATGNYSWYITPDSSTHWTITSLRPYYMYDISVAAVTIGLGPFSKEVTVRMPEEGPSSPPVNLTLVEKGSSYALLQWLPPPSMYHNGRIRHYVINLNDGNSYIQRLTTSTSQPSINIGFLKPDTTYTCSVAAVTVSSGPFSPSISFTTDSDVPGTVLSLVAIAVSSQSMNVSWEPPITQKGAGEVILDYQVNVTHFMGTEDAYMTTTESTSVVVDSLHPNYVYQCSVGFRTTEGLGPITFVLLKLPPDVPTGYPQNVIALPSDLNTLHIYWNPPNVEDQNGDIIHYGINITDVERGLRQYNNSSPHTSFIVLNLLAYTTYQYTVTAFTAIGHGPYSPTQTILTPPAAPSSAPFNLSLEAIGSTYALLRWAPPPKDQRNGEIQYYQIYLNNSRGTPTNVTTSGSDTHILLNILQPSTNYACTVAAVTVSPGPASTAIHFTTISSAPETVQFLNGTVLSSRSVNISWQSPHNAEHGRPILDYHVTISPLYQNSESRQNITTSTSIVINMLHPATFYLITVAARTSAGLQDSISILVELPMDVPTGHPQDIYAVATDSKTLRLTWSPPAEGERNGDIVQYGINLTDIESGEVTQFMSGDSITSFTIPDLHPYYHYNYTITAFTSVGNGPYTPVRSIQMPQDVPNGPPIELTVTNVSPGVVEVVWLPPPLDKSNGDITGYIIRVYDLDLMVKTEDIETDDGATTYTKRGLKIFYPYNFSVAAKTIEGWGPFSQPIPITTLPGVVSVPTGVSAQRISATVITVSWLPLTKDKTNLPILHYTIRYYPLISELRSRREEEHSVKLVNTTKNLTIDDLKPILLYNVSVAAITEVVTSNFSTEITVGLSENSLFQLFFSGAIDCQQWVQYHIDAKLQSARSVISPEIETICQCEFSADYILFHRPHCIAAHTDWLILWGRIVSTNTASSIDILNHFEEWSAMESKVVVEGVHLTTLKSCPVTLNEGESPYCAIVADTEGDTGNDDSTSSITYIIIGIVVMMLVLIFAVLICIATVSFYRKKKAQERQLRFLSAHPFNTFDIPANASVSSFKCKEDNDSNMYEEADNFYETIMDNESPYTELPNQPPPLPGNVPSRKQPQLTAEPQKTVSDGLIPPINDHMERCPSPIEYAVMKPNVETMPDSEEYATIREMGQKSCQVESTDEYVPMFDGDAICETEQSTYQNLTNGPSDEENHYQVPRPQKIQSEGMDEERPEQPDDGKEVDAGEKNGIQPNVEDDTS